MENNRLIMNSKTNRGGTRPGAGRPKGSGTGRTVQTVSFTLPPDDVRYIDKQRGNTSRGAWLSRVIADIKEK